MELVSEVVRTQYCIALTVPQFKCIEESDKGDMPLVEELHCEVDGISDVEYDAMFGPFVWYTVDKECDNKELHAAVHNIIRSHIGESA